MVVVSRMSAAKIGGPRLLAPTAAPTVAMATIITVAWRRPPTITGSASGSSMRVSTCARAHAHAARRLDDGRVDGRDAGARVAQDRQQRVQDQADVTGGLPNPSQIASSPNSAKLGMVRMVLVTARMTVANRSDRAATMPSSDAERRRR